MNPQPKQNRLILSKADWIRQTKRLIAECDYKCQCPKCKTPDKDYSRSENCLAPHHVKTKGAGGGDEQENIIIVCKECHHKIHSGEIKI